MAYIIEIDALSESFEVENLTFQAIRNRDNLLIDVYEDETDGDYPDSCKSDADKADYVRKSDAIDDVSGIFDLHPGSYVHLLQCDRVDEESVLKLYASASSLVILKHNGRHFIGVTCKGMDLATNVAYAYMILDGCVPGGVASSALQSPGWGLTREEYSELVCFINSQ